MSTSGAYISSLSHDILINQFCSREKRKKKKRLQITIIRVSHITHRMKEACEGVDAPTELVLVSHVSVFHDGCEGIDDGT